MASLLIIDAGVRNNGNTNFIANELFKQHEDSGAELVELRKLNIAQCIGCRVCKIKNSLCVVKDDMQPLYEKLLSADKIVIVAPNFMGFIPGYCKMFTDRWYCLRDADKKSRFGEGKRGIFILTQGSTSRTKGEFAVEWFKRIYENYGLKSFGMTVLGCSSDNTDGAMMKLDEIKMSVNIF